MYRIPKYKASRKQCTGTAMRSFMDSATGSFGLSLRISNRTPQQTTAQPPRMKVESTNSWSGLGGRFGLGAGPGDDGPCGSKRKFRDCCLPYCEILGSLAHLTTETRCTQRRLTYRKSLRSSPSLWFNGRFLTKNFPTR